MSYLLPRIAYVLRHVLLLWFCLALLGANLDGGVVDEWLQPTAGVWIERIGLRQYWMMFAPNPVHGSRFVRAWAIEPEGQRELPISTEPPFNQPFFEIGYNRIGKFQKKVTDDKSRYLRTYADALCREYRVRGSIDMAVLLYWTPSPSRRLQGYQIIRTEQPLGNFRCHL